MLSPESGVQGEYQRPRHSHNTRHSSPSSSSSFSTFHVAMQAPLSARYSNSASLVIDPSLVSPMSYINPSQILSHNAQAGSSSSDFMSAPPKRKSPASLKRKRTDTPEESGDSSSQQRKNRDGPKKKKANRACFHCQKAHLTCDDCTFLCARITSV